MMPGRQLLKNEGWFETDILHLLDRAWWPSLALDRDSGFQRLRNTDQGHAGLVGDRP
jgi:hypothetical protein